MRVTDRRTNSADKLRHELTENIDKQAGAELCQAQASLDLQGFDFIFLNFAGLV